MNTKPIYVTEADLSSLRKLLGSRGRLDAFDKRHLRDLEGELDRANIVSEEDVPGFVVTMRSRFRLKNMDSGDEAEYELVFPGEADISKGKISILAPVGTALLGYRELDTIEWNVPAGMRRFRIEEILYQPQAAKKTAHV